MDTIKVLNVIGKHCITVDQGKRIYCMVHPLLNDNRKVELDFTGVEVFAAPFFNCAVGRLMKDVWPQTVREFLSFKGIPDELESLPNIVIENSAKYYSDPNYKRAVDKALKEMAEGF